MGNEATYGGGRSPAWLAVRIVWFVVLVVLGAACRPDTGEEDVGGGRSPDLSEAAPSPASEPVAESVLDVLSRSADFTELLAALEEAGLDDTLRDAGPLTVFAPTDAGFTAARSEVLDPITSDGDQLTQLILAHVARGRWTPEELRADGRSTTLESLAGTPLRIRRDADDVVTVNEQASITQPTLEAGNGVVHAIDLVLIPAGVESSEG